MNQKKQPFIITDGETYFLLEELSQNLPYTEKYLEDLILKNILKGFKVDGYWYTSQAWIDEFEATVYDQLALEKQYFTGQIKKKTDKWVKPIEEYGLLAPLEKMPTFIVMTIFIFIFTSFFSMVAIVASYKSQQSSFLTTSGEKILVWQQSIDSGIKSAGNIFHILNQGEKISDESITLGWQKLFTYLSEKNKKGQVAGEMESAEIWP